MKIIEELEERFCNELDKLIAFFMFMAVFFLIGYGWVFGWFLLAGFVAKFAARRFIRGRFTK